MSSTTRKAPLSPVVMKKNQTILFFLLAGLAAGFMCGIVPAVRIISAQDYWKTGMYVLIAEHTVWQLLPWMVVGGSIFVFCGFLVLACARVSSGVRSVVAIGYVGLLCAGAVFLVSYLPVVLTVRAMCFLSLFCGLLFVLRAERWSRSSRTIVVGIALSCVFVLLTASAWFSTQSIAGRQTAPSFVLIVIDCLRPDHLGCYGYTRDTSPTIDALAKVGWHYERAYAAAPWTKPSVASLLSSLLPAEHGLVNPSHSAPDQLLLLAEVMRNAGYKNFFINGGNVFLKKDFNLDQGFHSYDYLSHRTRSADDLTKTFLARVAGIGRDKFFAYLHYMDAHAPYTLNSHNTRYAAKIMEPYVPGNPATQLNDLRGQDSVSPELRQYFRDLYDGQIRFVDDAIRDVLQGLKLLGRLDNTVFIITADHGEEFWDHGSTEHGHSMYNELLQVPLIIAGSAIGRQRIDEPVSLIDVMPTLLDLAEIPRDRLNLQGGSLLPGSGALVPNRVLYASGTRYGPEAYCLMQRGQKLVYRSRDEQGKWRLNGPKLPAGYQLFDLNRDPEEQNNRAAIVGVPPDLEGQLLDYMRTVPRAVSPQSVHVGGEEMRRQLESLGYVQ
jgi:choline-sulfatase